MLKFFTGNFEGFVESLIILGILLIIIQFVLSFFELGIIVLVKALMKKLGLYGEEVNPAEPEEK